MAPLINKVLGLYKKHHVSANCFIALNFNASSTPLLSKLVSFKQTAHVPCVLAALFQYTVHKVYGM